MTETDTLLAVYDSVRVKYKKHLKKYTKLIGRLNGNLIVFSCADGVVFLKIVTQYGADFVPIFNIRAIDQLIIEPFAIGQHFDVKTKQLSWTFHKNCGLNKYAHYICYACRLQKHKTDIEQLFINELRIPRFYAEVLYDDYCRFFEQLIRESVRIAVKHFFSVTI